MILGISIPPQAEQGASRFGFTSGDLVVTTDGDKGNVRAFSDRQVIIDLEESPCGYHASCQSFYPRELQLAQA